MSNCEQLRAQLEQIKHESARRKQEAKQAAQDGKKRKESAAPNWILVKEATIKIFEEINRGVLNSQGTIVNWAVKPFYKEHVYEWSENEDFPEYSMGGSVDYTTRGEVEIAELVVPGVGKVCVYRELWGESIYPAHPKEYFDWRSLSFKRDEKRIKHETYNSFEINKFSDLDEVPSSFLPGTGSADFSGYSSGRLSLERIEAKSILETMRKAISWQVKDLFRWHYHT